MSSFVQPCILSCPLVGLAIVLSISCMLSQRCARVSRALEAGIVWINCSQPAFFQAPWGGIKKSGFGRELGQWGLDAYTNLKQVTAYTSSDKWDWYPETSKNIEVPLTAPNTNGVKLNGVH